MKLLLLTLGLLAGCASAPARRQTLPSGLSIEDVVVGQGAEARLGSRVRLLYRGTLPNGKVFDSSGATPALFVLRENRLIRGWAEGIPGMREGGKRILEVPAALAYGARGTPDGTIPPNTDLRFEVELVQVK